jgi:hypothetical protein
MNSAGDMYSEYMKNFGLTDNQITKKRQYIGGSTAKLVWDGKWEEAYDRIMGDGEDLSKKFNVQLGHITERYNLLFQGQRKKWSMEFPNQAFCLEKKPYIGALVDAIGEDKDGKFVIDAKHLRALNDSGDRFKGYTTEMARRQYYWQGVNNMLATNLNRFCLSCVFGNQISQPMFQDLNQEHAKEYMVRAEAFWWHITNFDRPGDQVVDDISEEEMLMREVDMTGSNAWANHVGDYTEYESHSRLFEAAKKALKEMVEKDVARAYGNGVEIKRSASGSLLISRYEKEKAA